MEKCIPGFIQVERNDFITKTPYGAQIIVCIHSVKNVKKK